MHANAHALIHMTCCDHLVLLIYVQVCFHFLAIVISVVMNMAEQVYGKT